MYAWLWRHLPGPLGARIAIAVLLACAVVAVLFFVIFPLVEPLVPFNNVTTGQ
jgi:hypothetical protein